MKHLAAVLTLILIAMGAGAQEPVALEAMQHPGLLLKTNLPGLYVEAPTVSTDISLHVRGVIARGLVRQRFENTTDRCVEAVYVFPLADDATVDKMRLKVGVRTIDGRIKERAEATRVYEEAKSQGRRASLLEQHRPNLFTVSVASMAAGETAEIEIEYQQVVTYEEGKFSLRVPLTIAPRYTPSGHSSLPPMRHAAPRAERNPVAMHVDLDAGIALASVTSPTHEIEPAPLSGRRVEVKKTMASDRDFIIEWLPQLGALPKSAEFSETVGNERYTLLMLYPPDVAQHPRAVLPRETIFIIDTSGSMAGESLEQAKKALLTALRRVRPTDRFNVIEFNADARMLFPESQIADRANVNAALEWVDALQSDGGTEMLGALRLALPANARAQTSEDVRQVIFITDGQVENEPQVFAYIRENLGASRLFTIGIGNAPNTFFMRSAARAGRGTFTQIGDVREVDAAMSAVFRKLESPVLTDIVVEHGGARQSVRDLYAGEPLVVALKSKAPSARIAASGWNETLSLTSGESHPGVAKLWARQQIDIARDSVFTGANADDVRREIVTLALAHGIVTEHTSLVAVDTTPAHVDPQSCTSELIPINAPEGWGGGGVLPQGGTNATLWIAVGCVLLAVAWRMRA